MARRGNPNWVRAAEARREQEIAEVRREEMPTSNDGSSWKEPFALCAGIVGASYFVTKGAERLNIPRQYAYWGTVGVGFLTAANTKGVVHNAAMGAAAAGAVLGILDWIGFFTVPITPPQRDAAPQQMPEQAVEEASASVAASPATPERPIVEPASPETQRSPSAAALPAEAESIVAQRRAEIASHFTNEELQQVNQVLSRLPPDMASNLDKFIVTLPTDYVVQYIRSNILGRGRS
jgi:hypothetical protein